MLHCYFCIFRHAFRNCCFFEVHDYFHISAWLYLFPVYQKANIICQEAFHGCIIFFAVFLELFFCEIVLSVDLFCLSFFFFAHIIGNLCLCDGCYRKLCSFRNDSCFISAYSNCYAVIFISQFCYCFFLYITAINS